MYIFIDICIYIYVHTHLKYVLSLFNLSWQKILLLKPAGVTGLSRVFVALPGCA